ncbi:uncharacterized protein LOC135122189 [Zophobas morio]|uniref:uncharacterized protein LOC135122189 n=1 Tax=Zophobas morio TaxID=2755281 RepID=UPI0030834FF5
MYYENVELSSPQDIVNGFSKHFRQSLSVKSSQSNSFEFILDNINTFDIKQITESEVYNALRQLKPTVTAGPDAVPSFLVKDCAAILTKPLSGSVLGPLFFNIYVNDIVKQVNIECLLYADDLKIFLEIKSPDDCHVLQRNLDLINEWSITNQMPLSKDKCCVKTYSRKLSLISFNYSLQGVDLKRPEFIRDLGVTFDSKLSFVEHIRIIEDSANKCLGFVIRNTKEFQEVHIVKLLYFAYVRSRLEYCSVVWSPIYQAHISTLERIQRRALKYMLYKIDGLYPLRGVPNQTLYERLNVKSLLSRRSNAYIIMLHNIISYTIKCEDLIAMIGLRTPTMNVRNYFLFEQKFPRSNVMKASPFYQMLESYKKSQCNIDIFNCKLRELKTEIKK